MPFPSYPYGYQPTYYPQPVPDQLAQIRQQQIQPAMQPMMQPAPNVAPAQPSLMQTQLVTPNNGINWVGSKAEADNWPIAPGCAVALWDSNSPVIYLRKADSTGKPCTVVYDLVERVENSAPRQTTPQIDFTQFVTKEELEDILTKRLPRSGKSTKSKEEADNG